MNLSKWQAETVTAKTWKWEQNRLFRYNSFVLVSRVDAREQTKNECNWIDLIESIAYQHMPLIFINGENIFKFLWNVGDFIPGSFVVYHIIVSLTPCRSNSDNLLGQRKPLVWGIVKDVQALFEIRKENALRKRTQQKKDRFLDWISSSCECPKQKVHCSIPVQQVPIILRPRIMNS